MNNEGLGLNDDDAQEGGGMLFLSRSAATSCVDSVDRGKTAQTLLSTPTQTSTAPVLSPHFYTEGWVDGWWW